MIVCEREPSDLLLRWDGARVAVIVDAVAGPTPGTVHRLELDHEELAERPGPTASTHALDLSEVVELGRELGRMPKRLVVFGIEAESFKTGGGLSQPVFERVGALADVVVSEARGEPPEDDAPLGGADQRPRPIDGIDVDRDRVDPGTDQQLRVLGMDGGRLTADRRLEAELARSRDQPPHVLGDRLVALIEDLGDDLGVAVGAEHQLSRFGVAPCSSGARTRRAGGGGVRRAGALRRPQLRTRPRDGDRLGAGRHRDHRPDLDKSLRARARYTSAVAVATVLVGAAAQRPDFIPDRVRLLRGPVGAGAARRPRIRPASSACR